MATAKRKYLLTHIPSISTGDKSAPAVMGVFDTGKQLTDAVADLDDATRVNCLVQTIPANIVAHDLLIGHDWMGTVLNEWLNCPIALDETGA